MRYFCSRAPIEFIALGGALLRRGRRVAGAGGVVVGTARRPWSCTFRGKTSRTRRGEELLVPVVRRFTKVLVSDVQGARALLDSLP